MGIMGGFGYIRPAINSTSPPLTRPLRSLAAAAAVVVATLLFAICATPRQVQAADNPPPTPTLLKTISLDQHWTRPDITWVAKDGSAALLYGTSNAEDASYDDYVSSLALVKDGTTVNFDGLAIGAQDDSAIYYEDSKVLHSYNLKTGETTDYTDVDMANKQVWIASGNTLALLGYRDSGDGADGGNFLEIYNVKQRQTVDTIDVGSADGYYYLYPDIQISSDGSTLYLLSSTEYNGQWRLRVIDAATGQEKQNFRISGNGSWNFATYPLDDKFAVLSDTWSSYRVDLNTGDLEPLSRQFFREFSIPEVSMRRGEIISPYRPTSNRRIVGIASDGATDDYGLLSGSTPANAFWVTTIDAVDGRELWTTHVMTVLLDASDSSQLGSFDAFSGDSTRLNNIGATADGRYAFIAKTKGEDGSLHKYGDIYVMDTTTGAHSSIPLRLDGKYYLRGALSDDSQRMFVVGYQDDSSNDDLQVYSTGVKVNMAADAGSSSSANTWVIVGCAGAVVVAIILAAALVMRRGKRRTAATVPPSADAATYSSIPVPQTVSPQVPQHPGMPPAPAPAPSAPAPSGGQSTFPPSVPVPAVPPQQVAAPPAPAATKFCIYCGAELPAVAKFCNKCGKPSA